MEKIKEYILKYKLIFLIIIIILLGIMIYMLITQIINFIDLKTREKALKNDFNSFVTYLNSGKHFEASMMFEYNSGNELLKKYTKIPDKTEIFSVGYIGYIQGIDYMLVYYKKIDVKLLKINKITDTSATITVKVKKPNYLKYREECYKEAKDNDNFNYNKALIAKFNSKNVEYITDNFEINLKKVNGKWRLIYNEEMKLMIYGNN